MLRYGRNNVITDELMNSIASYMDYDIRESLHFKLAPCNNEIFLQKYVKLDPDFEKLLYDEFGIEFEENELEEIKEYNLNEKLQQLYNLVSELVYEEVPDELEDLFAEIANVYNEFHNIGTEDGIVPKFGD